MALSLKSLFGAGGASGQTLDDGDLDEELLARRFLVR